MKRETRIAILKDLYQESAGISDADLYEEAIVTLDSHFDSIDPETLYHRKRVTVIAYLALLNERERSIPIDWILKESDNPENPDSLRNALDATYRLWREKQ